MKKIILSAVALFAFGFANAQEKTEAAAGAKGFANGDVFITGAVSIGNEKTGDVKENSFEIAPSAGMFVTDNIAVGLRIGYESIKAENDVADTQDDVNISFGAFGRYYATPANDFSLFAELGFNFVSEEDKLADTKDKGFNIGLAPGVSYFIASNFALEASVGILRYQSTEPDGADDKTNRFDLGVDMRDISLGLVYKF